MCYSRGIESDQNCTIFGILAGLLQSVIFCCSLGGSGSGASSSFKVSETCTHTGKLTNLELWFVLLHE
uniref:Uncharacterized protein n=1 Tax=Physcomitrium patens TaxID=3218 RepID=A0A2K1JTX9_PHYPA|nr:hypothetical protein PHYPA_014755 [Physcomitrium patens]